MLRLSLLLIAGIGWLLAQSSGGGLSLRYFYQDKFLSNGAEVVFEFKLDGCTPGAKLSGSIEFGDGQSQVLTRITCERWRVPHTYYTSATQATLKIDGLPDAPTPVDLAGPPETAPRLLTYNPGSGNPGNTTGTKPSGGASQPQPTTYQLILKGSAKGLSGYLPIVLSAAKGSTMTAKAVLLKKNFLVIRVGNPLEIRAVVDQFDPTESICPLNGNHVVADITVSNGSQPKIDAVSAYDGGALCNSTEIKRDANNNPVIKANGGYVFLNAGTIAVIPASQFCIGQNNQCLNP